jgi:hypothetical protein
VFYHQLFEWPPAALALPTPSAACDLSHRSPLSPRDRVSPCALAAFLLKRLHSHRLACNQVSPWLSRLSLALCSCGIPLAMLALSRALVAIALGSRGIPRATLALSQGPINDQAAIVVGPPLLLGCHCCWAAIVDGLPSLLGCHCCWAAIIIGLPLLPYSLGLPPNGLFFVGLHRRPILLGCL